MNQEGKEITPLKKCSNREGLGGGSFYGLFSACPRKWAIKYILGFKEKALSRALIYGSAIHEGMEVFYQTYNKKSMIDRTLEYLHQHSSNYINPSDYTKDLLKVEDSLEYWYDKYGQFDLEKYELLGNETKIPLTLENGLIFNLRPDRIMRERSTGFVYVFDTKTSGVSIPFTVRRIANSDQPQGYLAGVKPLYPTEFRGWITDIIIATRGLKYDAFRPVPLEYDEYALKLWEYSLMSQIEDLTGRYMLLKDGGSIEFLFPYRKSACSVYACPYQDICNKNLSLESNPEDYGFDKDEWLEDSKVADLMESNFKTLISREKEGKT